MPNGGQRMGMQCQYHERERARKRETERWREIERTNERYWMGENGTSDTYLMNAHSTQLYIYKNKYNIFFDVHEKTRSAYKGQRKQKQKHIVFSISAQRT